MLFRSVPFDGAITVTSVARDPNYIKAQNAFWITGTVRGPVGAHLSGLSATGSVCESWKRQPLLGHCQRSPGDPETTKFVIRLDFHNGGGGNELRLDVGGVIIARAAVVYP